MAHASLQSLNVYLMVLSGFAAINSATIFLCRMHSLLFLSPQRSRNLQKQVAATISSNEVISVLRFALIAICCPFMNSLLKLLNLIRNTIRTATI